MAEPVSRSDDDTGPFARLANDLRDIGRQIDRLQYDRERDLAVQKERDAQTGLWRDETRSRLLRLEQHVDGLRITSGKTAFFDIDLKTMVVVCCAIGGLIYGLLRGGMLG